jgi:hypothetical protein
MQFKSTMFTGTMFQRALRIICCGFLLILSSMALFAQADPRETKLLVLERMWNEARSTATRRPSIN